MLIVSLSGRGKGEETKREYPTLSLLLAGVSITEDTSSDDLPCELRK